MLKRIGQWCHDNVLITAISCTITGGLAGVGVTWSLYEARVNRVEDMKVEAIKDLNKERQEMLVMIQAFTSALISDGKLSAEKRDAIAASLSKQYSSYANYALNLDPAAAVEVKKLQTSMNKLRQSLLAVQIAKDLDPFYLAMNDLFKAYKTVDPLVDRSIKTDQPASS